MRRPSSNPFLPGSDAVPPVWAGRALELADFHDVAAPRRLAGVYERGRIVLGEPGIGKSVLLNRLATEAADAGHWVLPNVRLAAGDDPVARLLGAARETLQEHAAGGAITGPLGRTLERVTEVTLPVIGGGVQLSEQHRAQGHIVLTEALVALAGSAADEDRLVLVRLDEIQLMEGAGLSRLLTALGDALNADLVRTDASGTRQVRKLPLIVYLSGLPEFYVRATAAGATFARRFKPLELGPLDDADLELALRPFLDPGWAVLAEDGPAQVRMEQPAADLLVDASLGAPFLFQLVGESAWNAGRGDVITVEEAQRGIAATRRETAAHFRLRLAPLTDLQQAFMRAAASLDDDERTLGRVATALGTTSGRLASTARTLDERHRLIRREAGRIAIRSLGLAAHLRAEAAP